jgi:hypothetical protein
MAYGIIEYNADGLPICEICGKAFNRVISHVRQKHFIQEREYKKQFGFDLKKGICSQESAELSRLANERNFEVVVAKNLLKGGKKSRYTSGNKGRTKDMVSEQTRLFLKARLKEPYMVEALKKSGHKLGASGSGNKARWESQNNINQ